MKLQINGLLLLGLIIPLAAVRAAAPDFAGYFPGKDACFILYDLRADQVIYQYNEPRCTLRFPPCSTFKIPLALMAFDRGVLADETTTYKWDGVDRGRAVWNRDTSAADWMRNSVVWYSQRLTPLLGEKTIGGYLREFNYGNRDISGGITRFWLDSTLTISADEQLEFFKRLWRGQLPVSRRAMALTEKIMYLETSPSGAVLAGKTGSGNLHPGVHDGLLMGWFIGHVAGPAGEYLVVTGYGDRQPSKDPGYPGLIARDTSRQILRDLNRY
jgi:beta-lactamase class D